MLQLVVSVVLEEIIGRTKDPYRRAVSRMRLM